MPTYPGTTSTRYDFDKWNFSLFFLAHLPDGVELPGAPGSKETERFLWSYEGTVMEVRHMRMFIRK